MSFSKTGIPLIIDEHAGLYVSHREYHRWESDVRLMKQFQQTWQRIPQDDRQLLADYWRTTWRVGEIWKAAEVRPILPKWALVNRPMMPALPIIETVTKWAPDEQPVDPRETRFAIVGANGCYLRFLEPAVNGLGDEDYRALIAHELGHCRQDARFKQAGIHRKSYGQSAEDDADATAERWGFDLKGLRNRYPVASPELVTK